MSNVKTLWILALLSLPLSAGAEDMFTVEYDCKHNLSREKDGLACSIENWSGDYWLIVRVYTAPEDSKERKEHRRYVKSILDHNFIAMGGRGIEERNTNKKTGKRMQRHCFPDKYRRENIFCEDWVPAVSKWE